MLTLMKDFSQLTPRGRIRRIRRLALLALARFGVEPASLSLLGHLFNTTFDVAALDDSRYALRIERLAEDSEPLDVTRVRIESELWWLDRLGHDLGLPVPAAVRALNGRNVVTVDAHGVPGPRLAVLFHWLDGRFLNEELTPAHLEQVGRLTARLHDHSSRLSVPKGFERPRVDEAEGATAETRRRLFRDRWSAEAVDIVEAVQQRVHAVQRSLGDSADSFGLIHADIHQENYLFHNGEVRLIDFDDCGWGYYLYDVAVTVHDIDELPHGPALREALLRGYQETRALPPNHAAIIDALCVLRELQMMTWFLEEWNNPSFQNRPAHVRNGLAMLARFLEDDACARGYSAWWED